MFVVPLEGHKIRDMINDCDCSDGNKAMKCGMGTYLRDKREHMRVVPRYPEAVLPAFAYSLGRLHDSSYIAQRMRPCYIMKSYNLWVNLSFRCYNSGLRS